MGGTSTKIAFEVCVVSGDYIGDELGPGVNMVMFDHLGNQSPTITLDNVFQNDDDHTQAKFTIDLQPWSRLKWYLDRVIIRDRRFGMTAEWKYFFFPVHRWITIDKQYVIHDCEVSLPQHEPFQNIRSAEISDRLNHFTFIQRSKGLPLECKDIPNSEIYSYDSRWDIEAVVLEVVQHTGLGAEYTSEERWDSLETLGNFYKKYNITEPVSLQFWMMNDTCFGAQRIRGCNPFVIQRCRSLPDNLKCVSDWIKPYLEGWTLNQMINANRLYITDYHILDGLSCKRGRVICAPIVLYFYTEKRQLKPIAIQLDRNSTNNNTIFLPTDPSSVWLQAKLWVNMADACHHMIVGRVLTHLILESIYVSMRRNLAQSHPIYHLLAPHFRSILPVTKKLKDWTFGNGWISRNIQLSRKGIKQLIRRAFKNWRFDINSNIFKELESRGVYDPNCLGNYPFREDALLIYRTLEQFVFNYVKLFYPNGSEQIVEDNELQSWRNELASPMNEGGLGLVGVPGVFGKTRFNSGARTSSAHSIQENELFGLVTVEDTVRFLMGILYLLIIVAGSALRLPMFDEYGFPAHYPLSLFGSPPSDRSVFSESSLSSGSIRGSVATFSTRGMDKFMSSLPNRQMTVETILYTRLASRVKQSALGHYESDFIFKKKAVILFNQFRKELEEVSKQIDENNLSRDLHHQYRALDPSIIPNYPGI